MSKKQKPELLSPAGSQKALEAAVKAGADAVYFGVGRFNARIRAENFREDELGDVAAYCHARNVKAYLTLNTLIKDSEIKDAFELAQSAWSEGIDAIIVQDNGLAGLLIDNIEGIRLHASTQMTAFNENACRILKTRGFKRVVLARELGIERLQSISEVCGIQTEVFIHGALCVSYSGQCLMSFVQGGRSSNRGECAQPCRQVYSLLNKDGSVLFKNRHLLSTKDLITTSVIKQIISSGVSSLKIEGRLKDEIYVAAVTGTYRKLIDDENIDIKEMNKMLEQIFLRGGGTKGFIGGVSGKDLMSVNHPGHIGPLIGRVSHQKNNKALISLFSDLDLKDSLVFVKDDFRAEIQVSKIEQNGILIKSAKADTRPQVGYIDFDLPAGTLVYKKTDVRLTADISEAILKRDVNIGVRGVFTARTGMSPCLFVYDDFVSASYKADDTVVVPTSGRGTSREDIVKNLGKTSGSPFYFTDIKTDIDDKIYIPQAAINKMRREALLLLEKAKHSKRRILSGRFDENISLNYKTNRAPKISVYVEFPGNEDHTRIESADIIYLPVKNPQYDLAHMFPDKIVLFLPLIDKDGEVWHDAVRKAYKKGYRKFLIKNIGQLGYFDDLDVTLFADYSMNIFNSYSAKGPLLAKTLQVCVSPELQPDEINRISSEKSIEAIVYGQRKVMTLEYALVKDSDQYILRESQKKRDFIVRAADDTVSIYENKPFCSYQINTDVIRFMFLDDPVSRIANIISEYMIEYDRRKFVPGKDT